MTIASTSSSTTIGGNGSNVQFDFGFVAGFAQNLIVQYTNVSGQTITVPSSQYTVIINAAAPNSLWGVGGTITYPNGIGGTPIADGTSLTITRMIPLEQLSQISNQGSLSLSVIEQALDTLCMEIQQVAARTGLWRGTWLSGIQYNYGDMVQDREAGSNTLNYYACISANMSTVWTTDLAAGNWQIFFNTQQVIGYATSAAASADAAAASAATASAEAVIATTAGGNAATSASSAVSSAATATTQATSATTSATSASISASSATTSASSAIASASTATTQATVATTQAGIATTQAGIATTEAGIATAAALAAASTLTATSTTSNTIGTGSFTFTTQANKNFFPGQFIIVSSSANGGNYIHGQISSYSDTTLVITESDNGGSGTHADWNISASSPQGTSGSGAGTVTTASVASLNGFGGSVANPTTTPAITITTSVTGLLKGNGTAVSAAAAGTDYVAPSGALGTPSSGVATNLTGTASGLTAGHVVTNANLTGDVTSSGNTTTVAKIAGVSVGTPTGTGNVVMSGSPTLVSPALGTPASGVLTNCTGTASGLTAGAVTTNANLTGDVTSSGNATTLATVNSNVGSYTNANVTVNGKGLITSAASGNASGITLGTPTAFNSATSYAITSLPAGIKELTMNLQGVTVSSASNPLFQVGDATGGLKNSGYSCTGAVITTSGGTAGAAFTAGFGVDSTGTIFSGGSGSITFHLLDAANFIWVANYIFAISNLVYYGAGQITLAGALDRITFTTVGGVATWTAGKINISYQ